MNHAQAVTTEIETRLILLLCKTPLSQSDHAAVRELRIRNPDWGKVFDLAEAWEVEPVVLSNLLALPDDAMLPALKNRARNAELRARALAVAGALRTVSLARHLEASGVNTIVLKGPALSLAAFGDVSLRTFADADLLVGRDDLPRAVSTLLGLGYKPEYDKSDEKRLISGQHALEFLREGQKVELHWSLLSKYLRLDFDEREVWESSELIECAGMEIRVMAAHHLLMFACAHGAKHEWERLRWIADVAQLSSRLSEAEVLAVVSLAERIHGKRLLLLGLTLTRLLLRADISRFQPDALGHSAVVRPLAMAAAARIGITTSEGSPLLRDPRLRTLFYWLRARERLRDRVSSLSAFVVQGLSG